MAAVLPVAEAPVNSTAANARKVIFAASLGTVFEWYDFYLYGSLAGIISKHFFSAVNETSAFIFALLVFSAGFAARPFGAIVFGRIGDRVGRKYSFLITIAIMGLSTFLFGLLPGYASWGMAAPIILVLLRLLQGLALGGEYGGAVVYAAEHAPAHQRGRYTGWIQTTATGGLLLSLLVVLGTRTALGEDAFQDWGWRVPFVTSSILVAISIWIRISMGESPVFRRMKEAGMTSDSPISESFGEWRNLRKVILALTGLVAGVTVVWYASQFYVLFFLTQLLKVDSVTANLLLALSLAVGMPAFVVFGALSDRIGRKPIILAGCALAALTYMPMFKALTHYANPALEQALVDSPVKVLADPGSCHFQFEPFANPSKPTYTSSCDVATAALSKASVSYAIVPTPAGSLAVVRVGDETLPSFDGGALGGADFRARNVAFGKRLISMVEAAGYPAAADPGRINRPMVLLLLIVLVLYAAMAFGPLAATMAEMFPTRIRYTSMSLPYHIGAGWLGGFLPAISFALVVANGNIYSGLWYPIAVCCITVAIGLPFVRETRGTDLDDEGVGTKA